MASTRSQGRIRRALRRLGSAVRERDFLGFFLLLLSAIPDFLCAFRCVIVTRGPAKFRIPVRRSPKNTVCRRLEPADVRTLEFASDMEEGTPEQLRKRFAKDLSSDHEGFVAEKDGKVVAYTWAAYNVCRIPEVRYERTLEPDEAQSLKSYVHPDHRFSPIYLELMRQMSDRLLERDIRWCFGHTDYLNKHSVRTHGRMGYEPIGRIALFEIPFVSFQSRRLDPESNRAAWSIRLKPRTEDRVNPEPQPSKVVY